jgi:hypothetical protein
MKSPRYDHKKPRYLRQFFPNPLQKHQQKQQNPGSNRGFIFFSAKRA